MVLKCVLNKNWFNMRSFSGLGQKSHFVQLVNNLVMLSQNYKSNNIRKV